MGPLDGVTVLDTSRLAPGPYCSMLLGDLGAGVIRIDAPTPPARTYRMLARNKRSIVLDLKNPRGREVFYRLCEHADVLLEGNRPGVMRRLGADYDTLAVRNPRLVYCSLTGYGQEGPLAQAAGHDINYIAIAGVLSQIVAPGGGPVPPLNLVADFGGGGLLAAFGIVAALFERTRSGRGQFIDAAMIDGAASLLAAHYSTAGELSRPGVGMLGGGAPFYRCYCCADGGYVAVGAIEPQFYAALCQGTGLDFVLEQMDRERWPEHSARFAQRFLEKTRDEWAAVFSELDACVSPVLDILEAPLHPHNVERRAFPIGPDRVLDVAPAPRFSRTPGSLRSSAPEAGADTAAILGDCGYDEEAVAALRAAGAFGAALK